MRAQQEGFTLVELMVVVLIIGVLVAIAIPVFTAASRAAAERTCQSNQRTIEGAVQQWLASEAAISWSAQVIDGVNDQLTNVSDPYLLTAPRCPTAPAAFYGVSASGTVTSDDLAAGDVVPVAWTSGTGHEHY